MQLEELLSEGVIKEGFYYKKDGYISPIKNWDTLAGENHIHAAVSASNEEDEAKKSEYAVDKLIKELENGYILDLGCGYGRLEKYVLKQRMFNGWIGLDSSANMLDIFNQRYSAESDEQRTPLFLINSDINQIPLKDSVVDNVVVSAVFLHNPKEYTKKSLEEVYRVMKPGGKIFIFSNFPNANSLLGLEGNAYLWLLKLLGKQDKNGPVRYFNPREVERLFGQFSSVNIIKYGFQVIPKTIIGLPEIINQAYRAIIANPLNYLFERILLQSIKQKYFFTHIDLIATK